MIKNISENTQNMYDTWSSSIKTEETTPKRVIQEIMHDLAPKHDFRKQIELHEKIRNDEDYDDWNYGTEPSYGFSWNKA